MDQVLNMKEGEMNMRQSREKRMTRGKRNMARESLLMSINEARRKKASEPSEESKPGFTPGEWEIKKARTVLHIGPPDGHVCEVSLRPSIRGAERLAIESRAWADARLIRAAPSLYTFLQKIYLDYEDDCGCECNTETCCAVVGERCAKCYANRGLALVDNPQPKETK